MPTDKPTAWPNVEAFRIVVAQPEDIPALRTTATASWWATYGDYLSASYIEDFLARAYSKTRLLAQMADVNSRFLVAKCCGGKSDDHLIGFGQVGPAFFRDDNAPVAPADLHRLYLLPAWQGRGIGARLLAKLEAWLRQKSYPLYGAYVHERNEPAQRFYARQGFIRKPECDVRDEWYLVKPLDLPVEEYPWNT